MQKVKEISLAHYHQGVSSSNEYAPVCNTKMIKILEIQIEYIDLVMVQHVPLYPIHPVPELNSHKQKHGS